MAFLLPLAQNNTALWQANWPGGLPIAAGELLDWHLFKDPLEHTFSTSVSSCLNRFLDKKTPTPEQNPSRLCQKVTVWQWSPHL